MVSSKSEKWRIQAKSEKWRIQAKSFFTDEANFFFLGIGPFTRVLKKKEKKKKKSLINMIRDD